jgi:hypothetical protein
MATEIERLPLAEFLSRLKEQAVPREHLAVKCVICGTVQSMHSLIVAGAGKTQADVERYFGFSCIGRWTNAGPHKTGTPPGGGCDWTLGGLLTLHKLEVIDDEGKAHPHFEVASMHEAKVLMASFGLVSIPAARASA